MSKQPNWKIWPRELLKTITAIGGCSGLLGLLVALLSTAVSAEQAAFFGWASMAFIAIGVVLLVAVALCLALERWQKKH